MAKKLVPQIGEFLPTQLNPAEAKLLKVSLGFNTGDVQTGAVQATYDLVQFNVPVLVLEVLAITEVAWTTSVTITIGDADAAAGWMASAKIAPQTAVTTNKILKATDVSTADAFAGGKLVDAAGKISAVVGGANPAAGRTVFYIRYVETAGL